MSVERSPQTPTTSSEQETRSFDVADRQRELLPSRLLAKDLMAIFGIKAARFYQLLAAGKFDRFELRPTIGRRAWSGKLVQAYLDGAVGSSRFAVVNKRT